MSWAQDYNPLHSTPLSTLIAWLPLATLFFVLLVLKKRAWLAALAGLIAATMLALFVFRMPPRLVGISALLGVAFGWVRIAWIMVASIYLYNIAEGTGQFRVMRDSIASLSADRRVQVILVAFCFGAFIEGTGGGGAPVAMVGAMLVGLGFPPLQAAKVCLLANTVPLAWGGMSSSLSFLAGSTGFSERELSAATGRILPLLSAILPFWLVCAMAGRDKAREVLPAAAVCGLASAVAQFYLSRLAAPGIVDICAAALALAAMAFLLRFWRPKSILQNETPQASGISALNSLAPGRLTGRQILMGWSPFLLASVFIFVCGIPGVHDALALQILRRPVPFLHNAVLRMPPLAAAPVPEPAIADLNIVAMNGSAIFAGASLAGLLLGLSVRDIGRIFRQTLARLLHPLLGVSLMVGFIFVTRYSGIIATMALVFTRTGPLYPFFAAFVGWMGVALTGTDAGSHGMFGYLQRSTAERLGLNALLIAAANPSGGAMGKLMDASSILVSATATRQGGKEGEIFKTVFKHSVMLTALVGLIILAYAYA
jgi:lactate permease